VIVALPVIVVVAMSSVLPVPVALSLHSTWPRIVGSRVQGVPL
jgi:hypothetical protein